MDRKALYKLEYGVFLVSTRAGDRANACITNTCIQAAATPVQLAISCINANYTTELIRESGLFTVSVLDESVTFETIKHFGMQSGRTVDKLEGQDLGWDENAIPYLKNNANAVFRCRVVSSLDLGSHTLFVGEVLDAEVLGDLPSLTYQRYQTQVKPKPKAKPETRPIVGWKCKICGYVYEGASLPADFQCPLCGHGPEDFEPVYGQAQ